MHDAPLTVTLFKHRSSQSRAVDVALLSVIRYIGRDRVFESGPGRFARQMNLDVAEPVLRILHLAHLRAKMIVAIICPTVVGMAALKDCERFIVCPDLCSLGQIIFRET